MLLVTLLVAGSLSDHLGRKPVVVAALTTQVASMALFLTAAGFAVPLTGFPGTTGPTSVPS